MKKTILIAAVMFLAFSVAASAQALFQVGSTPVTTVASCGVTELTGDVVFTTAVGASNITNGTITLRYSVPIASITGATAVVTDANGAAVPTVVVAIQPLPAPPTSTTDLILTVTVTPPIGGVAPYTIRLSGVRVNVAGAANLTAIDATVTATGNAFVGGQTTVRVVNSIASAIDKVAGPAAPVTISSIAPPANQAVNMTVTEGFFNAWVAGSGITFTFAGIPAGVTLTFPATITSSAGQIFQPANSSTGVVIAAPSFTSATTNPSVFYILTTTTPAAATTTETVQLQVTATFAGNPRPLAQGAITLTVNMGPPNPTGATLVPRFDGTTCQRGPVNVLTIVTANTTLLIPYATAQLGFDTGITIANTTTDNTVAASNIAVKQSGTITFMFFPQTPKTGTDAPFSYTTSSTSPGSGLTSGSLATGSTYVVLLSELFTAAGRTTDFNGYILAVCNFTNAHGEYFISNFDNFTHGALMMVVDPAKRNTSPESLGF